MADTPYQAVTETGLNINTEPSAPIDSTEVLAVLNTIQQQLDDLRAKITVAPPVPRAKPKIPPIITRNLLVGTILWQMLGLTFVVIINSISLNRATKHTLDILGSVVMLLFQILQLCLIVVTSGKLSKQIMHHTATPWFLIQSYLATTMTFAGIYTALHKIVPNSFEGLSTHLGTSTIDTVAYFCHFFYFSSATMSTVGYGDLTPREWWAQLLVTVQIFVSVIYTVIIFAEGVKRLAGPGGKVQKKASGSRRFRFLPF